MSDTSLYERPGSHPSSLFRQLCQRSPARPPLSLLSPTPCLSTLPFDILLNIAELLEAEDIIRLGKTSRYLRDFSRSRPIWLKLAANMLDLCRPLPLNGFQRVWELDTPSLAYLVRRGCRLQHVWTKRYPKLTIPYRTIEAPPGEEIVWLSPITSKYTLCCTKSGKVLCWDVVKGDCVAVWHSGADWEIWKCRVEFEERIVYFAMAKKVDTGNGTDCQLMALTFANEADDLVSTQPIFTHLSSFRFPGHVISVYLLDPLRRLLSAYIWIATTKTLGLYILLDWKIPVYVYINTGIACDAFREWSCIGYDPDNIVVHAEEDSQGYQFFYPYSFLRTFATLNPPKIADAPLVPPPRTVTYPFIQNDHPFKDYIVQSSHFVRQWWPTLPHVSNIRRRSCTIVLLTFRVPEHTGDVPPEHPPPGTHLFTIAQHYFSIPLQTDQLRWWYIRQPFEIVCFPHVFPAGEPLVLDNAPAAAEPDIGGAVELLNAMAAAAGFMNDDGDSDEDLDGDIDAIGNADDAGVLAADAAPVAPAQNVQALEGNANIEGDVHIIPLIAVDFGCAVWLEYVHFGSEEKRLRFVTFPTVDADRAADGFMCLSEDTDVRTLDVPPEIDLGHVCHIGIDQAQGSIILGLCSGSVYIMRYETESQRERTRLRRMNLYTILVTSYLYVKSFVTMRFRTGNEPEEPRESRKRLLSESEHDSHRHTRMQSEATGSRREFEPQKTSSLSRTRPSVRESKDAVRSSSRVRDRDRDYTRSRRSKDPEQCRSGVGHGIDRSQPCREESPHRSVKSLISTVFHWRRGSQGQDLERVLQAQNNGMKALISRLHAENWKLHDGVRALEDDVCKYQKNHEDAMREAAEHYNRQCAAYEAEKQHTIRQINQLAHTRESLEKALMQKTTLLETRTNELRTAETFLSKYDEIPGDEVVSLVSELNQLVLGIAEKCCDLFSFGKTTPGREKSSDEVEITNQLKSMVGSPLVDFLLSKDHNEDPTIVQLAIQAFLIIGLYDFLKYWPIPPHAGDFRSNYTKLYENIHEKEMQAVAARWRALGSKHLRLGFGIELRHVVSESEQWLKAILQIAGVQASESNTEQLKGDLERLWNLVNSIAEKIKESVLSTDYAFIFIHAGKPFEERIAKSQGHGDVKGTSPVLCSTELGLMRVTNIGTPGGAPHKLEEQVISKATVIFEHEIAQMFA